MINPHSPIVLSLAGHDPCGGAGIQADIEALTANGCRAATVVTCLTVQDTVNLQRAAPVAPELVEQQARAVLDDLPVAAIKTGLIAQVDTVERIADLLAEYPHLPVVIDPVLAAGGGTDLADERLLGAFRSTLLPHATLLTPNTQEARRLAGAEEPDRCAERLLALGCGNVLITGTHEEGVEVVNRLYSGDGDLLAWNWPRLPGSYHGSGCTLAAAIAAWLARGEPLAEAVAAAQRYTWNTLAAAVRPGRGQALPNRFPPAQDK
jgi:hydroxymethylpyrimidine/phosphomethylpyrimidine kinase